ncbi:ABC transporter ATP-binding protein/permease [Schlegelella sp. S2-27]|uniref:ABC transporter ATP-binding protein/permease n=1 Tax=Caldimonas mangrovi TaxID=2944811 RepID=A0ABT0YWB4_9BURK|nr:ABC transporter ATP-binding protein [Caldimonas mangrovi]MCM5682709.1 ABC transporter ATP-binding protein/permease [Caldimonas mangrovi]
MTTAAPAEAAGIATLYRHVWHHAQGMRLRWTGAMSLLVGSQLLKLCVPWLAAQAINTIQTGGQAGLAQAAIWIAAIVGIYVAVWSMHGPGRVLERSVGVQVRRGISGALYAKLTRVPLAWHDRHHSGDVQHRVEQASQALYDFTQNQFIYLQNAVNILGPLIALTLLSGRTGAIAAVGYVVVGLVIVRFDLALMRLAARENQASRRYAAGLLDFLGNVSTLMSLRLQQASQRLLDKRLAAVFEPLKRAIVLNELKWCAVDLLTVVLTWGLVVAFAWQAAGAGGTLLIGSLFMVYQYAQQAGGVVGSLAANYQNFARMRTNFASADPIWQAEEHGTAGPSIAADWQTLRLADIGFKHAGSDEQRGGLQHLSLELERGARIALVGPSGAGKSTLLRVLAGLYDAQHGHYEVDGVAQLGLRHLGEVATLIPQEAEIFEATVRENVAFDLQVDDAVLRQAVDVSAFDAVLERLPQGLDTPISERGFNLSGGQRQRLALARGVLAARGSSLILLDEPTSALDPLTELRIHQRLDAAFPQATIVASVHRMSLLEHFDRVVLMVAGQVHDSGTVAELLDRQPLFAEMYRGAAAADADASEAALGAANEAVIAA